MKVAIFLPNWVGDVVMATPALRAIRRRYSDATIVGVARPNLGQVLAGTNFLDDCWTYSSRPANGALTRRQLVQKMRGARFDKAVLFPNSLHTGLLAWFGGAKERIGFARNLRSWLLTKRVTSRPKHEPYPVMAEYLRLAQAMGCQDLDHRLELGITSEEKCRLETFWRKQPAGLKEAGVITFNTGGAFGGAKNWPREHFVELAKALISRTAHTVLVVCGPAEKDNAAAICAEANSHRVVSLAKEPPSLGLTKAAIRSSRLLVTTDSGPRHFAAAFDVPHVALYGATHQAWSDTFSPVAVPLQLQLDCGPCQQRECPLGHHRCMRDLSVATVLQAAMRSLATIPLRKSA